MAYGTMNLGQGNNYLRYSNGNAELNQWSNAIGFDTAYSRLRIQRYSIKVGSNPITNLTFQGNTVLWYSEGTLSTPYYLISKDANLWKTIWTTTSADGSFSIPRGGTIGNFTPYNKVLDANTTYYLYFFVKSQNYCLREVTGNISMSYDIGYSKCTAPTSLSVSPSIMEPNSSFEVSWSGAKGGINNSITNYDIYYKIGSAPSTSSYTGYKSFPTSSSSGRVTFTLPADATRGSKLYFQIKTIGSAGSTYYSNYNAFTSGVVNSIPSTPSLSVLSKPLPSKGGTVKLSVSNLKDADGQTLTVQYRSKAKSGTWTDWTSTTNTTFKKAITEETTFEVRSYDGLVYSSSSSLTVKLNVKPVLTGTATSETYKAKSISTWVKGITLNLSYSKTSSGTLTLVMKVGSKTYTKTQNVSNQLQWDALSTYFQFFSKDRKDGFKWSLTVQWDDGIEKSSILEFGEYEVASSPSFSTLFNTSEDTSQSGVATDVYSQNLNFSYVEDTTYTFESLQLITADQKTTNLSPSKTGQRIKANYDFFKLTNNFSIKAIFNLVGGGQYEKVWTNRRPAILPTFSKATPSKIEVKPFTSSGDLEFIIPWAFGSAADITEGIENYFGNSSSPLDIIRLQIFVGSQIHTYKFDSLIRRGDNLVGTIAREKLFKFNAMPISYSQVDTYNYNLFFTNVFGNDNSSLVTKSQISFNFRDGLKSFNGFSLEYYDSKTSSFKAMTKNIFLQEGMRLRVSFQTENYGDTLLKFSLKYSGRTETFSISSQESKRAVSRTAVLNTFTRELRGLPSFGPNEDVTFSVTLNGTLLDYSYDFGPYSALYHAPARINLESATINKNHELSYSGSIDESGIDNRATSITFKTYLVSDHFKEDYLTPLSDTVLSITEENLSNLFVDSDWSATTLRLYVVSTQHGFIDTVKTSFSNELSIFVTQPTVAYRANTLGINIEEPDIDTVLDLNGATGKTKIKIKGFPNAVGDQNAIIVDLLEERIDYYTERGLTRSIDFKNGQIKGFLIS